MADQGNSETLKMDLTEAAIARPLNTSVARALNAQIRLEKAAEAAQKGATPEEISQIIKPTIKKPLV